ncbi:MAG: hypothetical protein KatS3mg082_3382 [Nitrospiraceae bacterium]|nr:MAG: hypothetical protein KatS3mg082_3382 [Nitrospiraceae bacterium]
MFDMILKQGSVLYRVIRKELASLGRLGRLSAKGRFASYEVPCSYFGRDPPTCVFETILRDHRLSVIPESWITGRLMVEVKVSRKLTLANLSDGHALQRLGLDVPTLLGPGSYALCAEIGRQAYAEGYDGIIYPSRFNGSGTCVALFDRAHSGLLIRNIWSKSRWEEFAFQLVDKSGKAVE